jgi:hypothetical protein
MKSMKPALIRVAALPSILAPTLPWAAAGNSDAQAVLQAVVHVMGGRDLLLSLRTLRFDIRETQFRLDDSELLRDALPSVRLSQIYSLLDACMWTRLP